MTRYAADRDQGFPPPERGRSEDRRSSGWGSAADSKFSRTPQKTATARKLRREMTSAEQRLWLHLRRSQMSGCSFRRQHPAGRHILDFYCPQLKLAIELDGDQHGWERNRVSDAARDQWLVKQGVTVLRFWNVDLLANPESVLQMIYNKVEELSRVRTPTQPSPFQGEEKTFWEIDR